MSSRLLVPVAAAIALFLGVLLALSLLRPADTGLQSGIVLNEPRPIRDFRLTDHTGAQRGPDSLRGHWTAVFPGFTHCPDICPNTLALLAAAWQRIPEEQRQGLEIALLSVDPERDRPEALAQYVTSFSPDFVGLTGEEAQIAQLARDLAIAYQRTPLDGGGYTVDHTAAIVLINPQGRVAGYLRQPFSVEQLEHDLSAVGRRS